MWSEGSMKVRGSVFRYSVKHYEEGSVFGIDNGRISKLLLQRDGRTACSYDRGWDIEPADEDTRDALAILVADLN